jgi:hypothetical protein
MKWLPLLLALPCLAQKTHEVCSACHQEHVVEFQTHKHFTKGLSCDACHGKSAGHANSNGAVAPDRVSAPDEQPALCGACHTAQNKDYRLSKHAALLASKTKVASCATCHGVHSVRTAKQRDAQCQKCHASLKPAHPSIAAGTTCFTCHANHTLKVRAAAGAGRSAGPAGTSARATSR